MQRYGIHSPGKAGKRIVVLLVCVCLLGLAAVGGWKTRRVGRAGASQKAVGDLIPLSKDFKEGGASRTSPSRDSSAKPIPVSSGVQTHREFESLELKWARRTSTEAYLRIGLRNPSWDKQALALFDLAARDGFHTSDAPSHRELLRACAPLINSHCSDPLILDSIGGALLASGRLIEAEGYFRRAVEGYRRIRYPRGETWGTAASLAALDWQLRGGREKEAGQWLNLAIEWIGEAAHDGSFVGDERRVFWDMLIREFRGSVSSKFKDIHHAVASRPGADPWILAMLAGKMEEAEAWKARGIYMSDTVTSEGWKGFFKHLGYANNHFTRAWKLHLNYPEAATAMVRIAMSQQTGTEDIRRWFDRAVSQQMDYMKAYDDYLWTLEPWWYGSMRDMYDFGLQCLATKRFDTEVPQYLFKIVWHIAEEEGYHDFWKQPGVYENLMRMFEGVYAEPSRASQRLVIRSVEAAVSWRCGRYLEAWRLLSVLGPDFDVQALGKFGGTWWAAPRDANEFAGPAGKEIARAERLYSDGHVAEAYAIYQKALSETSDKQILSYLRERTAIVRVEVGLKGDQWVDLTPDRKLSGWYSVKGRADMDPGGGKVFSTLGDTFLLCGSGVGYDYEIRGEIEPGPSVRYYAVYIGLGTMRQGDFSYTAYPSFCLSHWQGQEARLYRYNDVLRQQPVTLSEGKNTFLIHMQDFHVTAYINDRPVFANVPYEPFDDFGYLDWINIEAQQASSANKRLLFRNLQIRRLNSSASTTSSTGTTGQRSGVAR